VSAADIPAPLRAGAKSGWTRRIADEDIARFAEISGDKGRHHLERDAQGRLLAHGLLTASLPTKLGGDAHFIARTMEFEFLGAVYGGDELTCDGVVEHSALQSSRIKVRFGFTVRNQRGEIVLLGTSSGHVAR
jgi:3-hydroxybutyryl-CoA dehydratase